MHPDRPCCLAPTTKGAKVYAVLRKTLLKTQRIGLARGVIQTRQYLAALPPVGPAPVCNLLRWGSNIKPWTDPNLLAEGTKAASLGDAEPKMAVQLVGEMMKRFKPEAHRDSFKREVTAPVRQKVGSGDTEAVVQPEPVEAPTKSAEIIDLADLLTCSMC